MQVCVPCDTASSDSTFQNQRGQVFKRELTISEITKILCTSQTPFPVAFGQIWKYRENRSHKLKT